MCVLRLLVVVRSPAVNVFLLTSGKSLYLACRRHNQKVAHLAIPSHSAHLRHGKALYGLMFIAVAGTIVSTGDCLRTYLYHTVGSRGTRESLPEPMISSCCLGVRTGSDKRVHPMCKILVLRRNRSRTH